MDNIWKIVTWSFRALYEGTWPSADWDENEYPTGTAEAALAGTPLADGYFGVPFIIKDDWDHFGKTFGLRKHNSKHPRDVCRCEKGRGSDQADWPSNFRREARWKRRLLIGSVWRKEREEEGTLHQFFAEFPFITNENIMPDEMHVIHLGTNQYLLGSVLWKLIFEIMPGTPLNNMEALWLNICNEYRASETKSQFSSLGISSFTDAKSPASSYPRLKGRAAEIKWLVPVLRKIWSMHKRPGNDCDQLVTNVLEEQVQMQNLIDEGASEFQMDSDSSKELVRVVDRWLAN
jgi:hypothetical protein